MKSCVDTYCGYYFGGTPLKRWDQVSDHYETILMEKDSKHKSSEFNPSTTKLGKI